MTRLLFLLSLIVFSSFSCSLLFNGDDPDARGGRTPERREPSLILSRFVRISENTRGEKEWVLKAREARFFEQEHRMFLTDFIITFYQKDGANSSIRARRGIIHTRTRDLEARRKVFLQSSLGRTLATEELFGNMRTKIITNAVFNRITTEDGTVLTGTDLYGRNDLKVFKLKNAVGVSEDSNLTNKKSKRIRRKGIRARKKGGNNQR